MTVMKRRLGLGLSGGDSGDATRWRDSLDHVQVVVVMCICQHETLVNMCSTTESRGHTKFVEIVYFVTFTYNVDIAPTPSAYSLRRENQTRMTHALHSTSCLFFEMDKPCLQSRQAIRVP
jgi:hypothetical protein